MPRAARPLGDNRGLLAGVVLSWMFLFGLIGTGLVGPNRTAIEREMGLSHAGFGAAFALVQIVCAILVLGAVSVLPRFRNHSALGFSLLVQAVGFAAVFLSRGRMGLIAGWTLITLGVALGSVANTVSARLWAHDPRKGVALLHGLNGLGKVAGPLIAAACLALGWRLSFLVVGALTLGLLALLWRGRSDFAAWEPPPAGDRTVLPASLHLLGRPFYWLCVLPFGLIAGGDVCFAALVPVFYETRHQASPAQASLLLVAHLIGLACGRFAFTFWGGRLSNNAVIALCLAGGLFALPAALASAPWVWAAALFGVGIQFSSTWPTFYAQVSSRFFPPSTHHLLDYGSGLGNALGIAVCVYASSVLADRSLVLALLFGPTALWLFGVVYFCSPLSRAASPGEGHEAVTGQ